MNLEAITLTQDAGSFALHVGTADKSEVARLVTEPHAVLNDYGVKVGPNTPVRLQLDYDLEKATEVVIIIIIIIVVRGGGVVVIVNNPNKQ